MKSSLKVVTVVGTRPEIIRMSSIIKQLDRMFDHTLVHTGQNWDYALNEVFFKDLDLRAPDISLKTPGQNLGETIGNIISASYSTFLQLKPDALVILGDTNSALCALSAKRLKIPIFHLEAGNRCFDLNVPEEINRKLVDHLSDINLCYTEHSRRNLLAEGMHPSGVFVVDSPMREVIYDAMKRIDQINITKKFNLYPGEYFVFSTHREENVDNESNLKNLFNSANILARNYNKRVIVTTHPRTRQKLAKINVALDSKVDLFEPFGFLDYIALQKNSFCVLSDSGTLSEESAILDFPAVLIRTSTERPEVLDHGTVVIGGISERQVIDSVHVATKLERNRATRTIPANYQSSEVSIKVASIVASYSLLVREKVWGIKNGTVSCSSSDSAL